VQLNAIILALDGRNTKLLDCILCAIWFPSSGHKERFLLEENKKAHL